MELVDNGARLVVTFDDHRAIIVIAVAVCVLWSILVVCARMLWRTLQKSDLGLDDCVAAAGTLISMVQAGLTIGAVRYGLGKDESIVSPSDIERAGTYIYVANLFYILSMFASRASMPLLIARLTRDHTQTVITYGLLAVTAVWGLGSFLAIALTCGIPIPWAEEAASTCSNLYPAWTAIEALGLAVELMTIGMVVILVRNLNMLLKFKIAVITSFSFRLLIIAPVIYRIIVLREISSTSSRPFFDSTKLIVATQFVLHYSLWAASFPCMRAFLRAFDTGMGVTTSVPTFKGSNYKNETKGTSFAMTSLSGHRDSMKPEKFNPLRSATRDRDEIQPTESNSTIPSDRDPRKNSGETSSNSSRRAIITRTVEWEVHHEDVPKPGSAF